MEVVPSHVFVVQPLLASGYLFSISSVSLLWSWWDDSGDCKIVVERVGGRRVWWSAVEHWGSWFFGAGINPCPMAGTNAVMPTSTTIPSLHQHECKERGGNFSRAQRLRIIIVFVDSMLLTLLSFLFCCFSLLFFFFWARLCYGTNKLVVSCGCYINIAGWKPVLRL
jgi:hypothetical protein